MHEFLKSWHNYFLDCIFERVYEFMYVCLVHGYMYVIIQVWERSTLDIFAIYIFKPYFLMNIHITILICEKVGYGQLRMNWLVLQKDF